MRFYKGKFKFADVPQWLYISLGFLVVVNLFLGYLFPCVGSNIACLGIHPDFTVFREDSTISGYSNLFEGKILEDFKSEHQHIKVMKSPFYGEMLIIDDRLQITSFDGDFYHEMIAHVPVNSLGLDKSGIDVLIIGGGDLGAAHQVLRHKNVNSVELVDIDKDVVAVSTRHFTWAKKAVSNDRLTITYDNGAEVVKAKKPSQYDVIIIDSTNSAKELTSPQFYKDCSKLLKTRGALVANMNSAVLETEAIKSQHKNMKNGFEHVHLYQVAIPSFLSGHYMFAFASNTVDPPLKPLDKASWEAKDIQTSYYTPDIHYTSFLLPIEFRLGDDLKFEL